MTIGKRSELRTLLVGSLVIGSFALAAEATRASAPEPSTSALPAARLPSTELPPPPLPTELPAWASPFPADEALSDEAHDAIQHEARALAKVLPEGSMLRSELFARLVVGPRCGRAHAAAVAGVFAESSPSEIVSALSTMHTECNEVLIEGAGFSAVANTRLAATLADLAEHASDGASRRAAWLSYGSLGETARRSGDVALASSIDQHLALALRPTKGDERVLLVKASGNAGCSACVGSLGKDVVSPNVALRSAAVAAHRFVDEPRAVAAMCRVLGSDHDDAVRDMAAWSLEWRGTEPNERAECLEKAARSDASTRVRMQATLALGVLADDHVAAQTALERLANDPKLDVRSLAARALEMRTKGPDQRAARGPSPLLASLED